MRLGWIPVIIFFCPFLLRLCLDAEVWRSLDKNQTSSHAGMLLFFTVKHTVHNNFKCMVSAMQMRQSSTLSPFRTNHDPGVARFRGF